MAELLENQAFQVALDLDHSCWSICSAHAQGISLEGAELGVRYRSEQGNRRQLAGWIGPRCLRESYPAAQPGNQGWLCLQTAPNPDGLALQVDFSLPEGAALLRWRVRLENQGLRPVFIDRLDLLRAGSLSGRGPVGISGVGSRAGFFSNGWQSWSLSGVYGPHDRFLRSRLGPIRVPTETNPGTLRPGRPGRFAADWFGVLGDRGSRRALLAGFLSQRQQFGSLEARLAPEPPGLALWANGDGARLDPGAAMTSDWACLLALDVDSADPLGPFIEAVQQEHSLEPQSHPMRIPTGWCSWYQYSLGQYIGAISADQVRSNLKALEDLAERLPLEVVQIDDGFEAQVGDWFSFTPGFPQGVAPLAEEIHRAGFTPGLWLAPFIVHPRSRLAGEHPEWLLKGRLNRPANAGFLWNSFAAALDLTRPEALDYACRVVHTAAHDWGFPYLKLDFLYAAALPGRRSDPTRTRAQVLRAGLEAVRQAAGPQTYLLGCGCPLGPAVGLVDAMRIGTDTARHWKPAFAGISFFFDREPNFPAMRNALQNVLARAPLHRRWWVNDPDCLLLNPHAATKRGTPEPALGEVQAYATAVALTGGSLLLSDDLAHLEPERLQVAQALLPVIGKAGRVLDWFDAAFPRRLRLDLENALGPWSLLACFNWEEAPRRLRLDLAGYGFDPAGEYLAREFWSGEEQVITGGSLQTEEVAAHGAALIALRRVSPGRPQYTGGSLHISQGLEVTAWEETPGELTLLLERPGPAQGEVVLRLPAPPVQAQLDEAAISWRAGRHGCYHFGVEFERTAWLRLSFSD